MIVRLAGLHASYGSTDVLRGVDLHVAAGEAVGVLGANGAGKTTLMRVLSGQLAARRGELEVFGSPLTRTSPARMVRRGVVLVAEGHDVVGPLTVAENLRLGAFRFWPRTPPAAKETLALIHEFFPILAERRHQVASLLSGGQQQMLAIGRALMAQPTLLLLDEPSLGLAPIVVDEIYDRLGRLRADTGLSMLLVEQSSARAVGFCDRIHVMRLGEIVAESGPEGLGEEELRLAYFGA